MAISHVKSNTISDLTGTVTVYNSVGSTQTLAATDLVRPSDWNSAHNIYYSLAGNTNNASSVSGTNVYLSGGNNVTLVGSSNSIGFSVGNYITTGALSDHSHGNPTLNLTNLSGTTGSNSAGFTLSLSAADPGGGGVALAAGTQSVSTGTVNFNNSNGITFGMSGSSRITASHNGLTTAAQSNHSHSIEVGLIGALSATTAGNSNGVGFTLEVGNYLTTGALSDHSHGNPTLNLTNLSGTTGSNSAGFTLSLSAAAPGGGAGVTYNNGWSPHDAGVEWVAGQQGNATCFVQPITVPGQVNVSNFKMPTVYTNASNSSNSFTVSFWVGVYTKNGASLSSLHSTSWSTNVTNSGTAGSYSLFAVMKVINIPWTTTITAGEYWVGIVSRTTTGAGAGMTMSQMLASQPNSNWSGYMGVANNATNQVVLGQGFYGTTTAGVLGSMAFSQIQGTGSLNLRPPIFFFGGSTH